MFHNKPVTDDPEGLGYSYIGDKSTTADPTPQIFVTFYLTFLYFLNLFKTSLAHGTMMPGYQYLERQGSCWQLPPRSGGVGLLPLARMPVCA